MKVNKLIKKINRENSPPDGWKPEDRVRDIYDLPDGWTCVGCGDEYLDDTEGKLVANYDQGTLCKKCHN